jgi:hypothetical protein
VTLILVYVSDRFGGHRAALGCGILGALILAILYFRPQRGGTQPEEPAEDVRAEDLLAIFDDKTDIQAQLYVRPWLGKRVRLDAEMWDVSPSAGRYMVSLAVNGFNHCYFFIPKTQLDDYTHIQRGTTITVVATVAKLAACNLELKKVQLVKVAFQPVA